MTPERRVAAWIAFLVAAILLLVILSGVLLPFIAGMAVAYFLDPVADRLEARGLSRTLATILILLGFFVVAVTAAMVLAPLLQAQVVGLAAKLPHYVTAIRESLTPLVERLWTSLGEKRMDQIRGAAGDFAGTAISWLGDVLGKLWRGGAALVDILSLMVVTPVVAFYLLRDWDLIITTVDGWLPRESRETIHQQVRAIDRTLSGFARGQATLCVILGSIYGVGLSIVGLDFGLLVGLGAGMIAFIPYFGTGVGLATAFGLALMQGFQLPGLIAVGAVFATGQALDSFLITPRLVGDKVGLHPVWVIFALLAAGSLFGFTGVLLGVPVAAVIGVLVRFGLDRYIQSTLYLGEGGTDMKTVAKAEMATEPTGTDVSTASEEEA